MTVHTTNRDFFNKLKFQAILIGIDPNDKKRWKYHVTMFYNDNNVWAFDFFMGCGNGSMVSNRGPYNKNTIATRAPYGGKIVHYNPPKKLDYEEVVYCIANEARIGQEYDHTDGKWEFFEDFGYEANRESERVYHAVIDSFKKAREVFGADIESFIALSQDPSEWDDDRIAELEKLACTGNSGQGAA